MPDPVWKRDPDEHDYPAALEYLQLLMPRHAAKHLLEELRKAPTITHPAKDILRAADDDRLPYPRDNEHVAKQLGKVAAGEKLSPVLLVADVKTRETLIADGSHRISAAWWCGENTPVPCRIAYRTR